ncbi:MAG: glucose 1-dehydrogenase [Pleurocapsa sp. MO_226.B13]|nr:glucose 1-dehydrogenase [Pleurocapsa sp. MO_226.B13]
MLLEGKVALVTGGAKGLGRATVQAMIEAGAKVVISDINVARGENLAKKMRALGGKAIFQQADVTLTRDVQSLIQETVNQFGRLDIAFNNACVDGIFLPLAEQSEEDVAQIIDVNIYGVWLSMKYEIKQMLKNNGGAIVNSSCIYGLKGYPGLSVYVASKHAITGMSKSVALEYAKRKIRVNAIAPGFVDNSLHKMISNDNVNAFSEIVPMGRIPTHREIANSVVWLCSDLASFVTGHTMPIEGGFFAQ